MAIRYAFQNGNWSDPLTWDGQVSIPDNGDDVYANGKLVVIDQDIAPNTLRTTTGTGIVVGGQFRVESIDTVREITVTQGIGNVTTTVIGNNAMLLAVSAPTGILNINSDVRGGATSSYVAMRTESTCAATININGEVRGGTATSTYGLRMDAIGATVNVAGGVFSGTGTTSYGVYFLTGTGTLNVGGNVGDTPATSIYVLLAASAYITVGGAVWGSSDSALYGITTRGPTTLIVNGSVVGGGAASSYGIYNTNANSIFDLRGPVIAMGSCGIYSTVYCTIQARGPFYHGTDNVAPIAAPRWAVYADVPTTWYVRNNDAFPATGSVVPLSNAIEGTPEPGDVRKNTAYGAGGSITGTLAVPPADSVASGVPVDDTVGTAAVRLTDIAAITGNQLTAILGN